jgi:hypothetical protein
VGLDQHAFAVPARRHDARRRCVTARAEAQLSRGRDFDVI